LWLSKKWVARSRVFGVDGVVMLVAVVIVHGYNCLCGV